MLTEDERFDTRDALESCDICQLRFPTEDLENHICPDCWAELEQTEYSECRCPRCGVLFDCDGRAEVACCDACLSELELEEQWLRDHEYPDDFEEDCFA